MDETLEEGYLPTYREELGEGAWLVMFRCIRRQTGTIGLEIGEMHRFDDRAEYCRFIREKMQVLRDRLMEAWESDKEKEEA